MNKLKIIQCAKGCGKEIEARRTDVACEDCKKKAITVTKNKSTETNRENNLAKIRKRRAEIPGYREHEAEYNRQYRDDNLEECKERQRKWRTSNPAKVIYGKSKHAARKNEYAWVGDFMSLEDFTIWYSLQPKECAICGTTETLCFDHSHLTGEPRGLLCQIHNKVEGLLRDSKTAERLAEYMRKFENYPTAPSFIS